MHRRRVHSLVFCSWFRAKRKPFGPRGRAGRVRLDLHNHTRHSPDSRVDPADLVRRGKAIGLDGIARASRLADAARVGRTGGSDSHILEELGRGVTVLDGGGGSVDDALQAVASRKTSGEGVHRGARATAVYVTKCLSEWTLRGMRRI